MDSRIDKCASCCGCLTRLPAASHVFSTALLLLPFFLAIGTLAYSEGQRAVFPPTYTSWRIGLSSASLILCLLSALALHKMAPGTLRLLGWCFSVIGHWAFVLATIDAQFASSVCHSTGWGGSFCSTAGTYTGAAASLTTAAGLDVACLLAWLFAGGVLQQRAARLTAQAEQAAAAAAVVEGANLTGNKRITISVS